MNNDLISRDALREDLRRFFPTEVLEGIEPKTLFAQIMHDIDNAPTVETYTKDDMTREYLKGYNACKDMDERPQGDLADKVWKLYEKHQSHLATYVIEFGDELKDLLGKYQKGGAV